MTLKRLTLTSLLAVAVLLAAAAPAMAQEVEWDYDGERGPDHWGELTPAFATCTTGQLQSPIDLRDAEDSEAPRIRASYRPTPLELENNGHTLESVPEEEQTLRIGGKEFGLAQFHMHVPSEHTVTGRRYPLELHFVHQATDGERAVLGVLVKRGERNETFGRLPLLREEGQTETVEVPFNLRALMPRRLAAYRYLGSLTTPPCSEGIRWNVAVEPIELSRRQIARVRDILGSSARPLQQRDGRELIVG
jgi:carbonic anhydrase